MVDTEYCQCENTFSQRGVCVKCKKNKKVTLKALIYLRQREQPILVEAYDQKVGDDKSMRFSLNGKAIMSINLDEVQAIEYL